jgi:hypothetical protein
MWWFVGIMVVALAVYCWFEVRSWKKPMVRDYEPPGGRGSSGPGNNTGAGLG